MLRELRISRLGVIDDATVELSPGLTVITGETGAGKTMLVTGLDVLLGGRFDAGLVRVGADRALVEARLDAIPPALAEQAADLGAELESGELLLARQVTTSGRTRAMLGGVQVPAARSAGLLGELVTVHGQSEQLRLTSPDRQRDVLDAFAGAELAPTLAAYHHAWAERRAAAGELAELTTRAHERAREIDLLAFGLAEIERADPQRGEDTALAAEAGRLQAVDELRLAAASASQALSGDDEGDVDGAIALMSMARRALQGVADRDPAAAALGDRLTEAGYLVNDLAADVAGYLADLEADPARLEWVTGRRAELSGLMRKYGSSVDEVLAWAQESAGRLGELSSADDRIDELRARVDALTAQLDESATAITSARADAAERLTTLVQHELVALAMPHARLLVELTPLHELGPHGRDGIALLFSANPGSEPGPLGRIASGGELSRVRLAIEVVLASGAPLDEGHTFVFDEVDAGIGGAVGIEVGRRLARLAEHAQVLVVTHLAQVAAFADTHVVVHKTDDGQVTTSDVRALAPTERSAELARMMSGLEDARTAREHADELLRVARDTPAATS